MRRLPLPARRRDRKGCRGYQKGGDEVEQRAQPDARGHEVILADGQMREPFEARGVTRNQAAAAQEGMGRVAGLEVACGGVAELGCGVGERRRAAEEQGDQRLQADFAGV